MILALINSKGGVGKTTTAVNVAAALAEADARVLLVDLDPNGYATIHLGFDRDAMVERSVYDLLIDGVPAHTLVQPTSTPGLELLPAERSLASANVRLAAMDGGDYRLKRALTPLRGAYDWILIDCAPELSKLPTNALLAADRFLIPTIPDHFGVEGLREVIEKAELIREAVGQGAELLGVVLTVVRSNLTLHREMEAELRERFDGAVFEQRVPQNVKLAEAQAMGRTIFEHDRHSPGAAAYRAIAAELIQRTGAEHG